MVISFSPSSIPILTLPSGLLYLTALDTRLLIIFKNLSESRFMVRGWCLSESRSSSNLILIFWSMMKCLVMWCLIRLYNSTGSSSSSRRWFSSFERSRISFTSFLSWVALRLMNINRLRSLSVCSEPFNKVLTGPKMRDKGVLNSWDTFAKNLDFKLSSSWSSSACCWMVFFCLSIFCLTLLIWT